MNDDLGRLIYILDTSDPDGGALGPAYWRNQAEAILAAGFTRNLEPGFTRNLEQQEEQDSYDNLDRAAKIIEKIDVCLRSRSEIKAAFATMELDGGTKAALDHPLVVLATARLAQLREELTLLT
jgi:hypothetical protein